MEALLSVVLSTFFLFTLYRWYHFQRLKAKLRNIPTIGGDSFPSSYISAWKNVLNAHLTIQEGYQKYPNAIFKIPSLFTPSGWTIVVNGSKLGDDIRKAGARELTFRDHVQELLQLRYQSPINTGNEPYHVDVVRVALTRGYPSRFADLADEVKASLADLIPAGKEWTDHPLHGSMIHVISRVSNRVFVGLPLCRNPEYLRLVEDVAIHMWGTSAILNLLPSFARPIVAPFLRKLPNINKALQTHLGDVIRGRLEERGRLGDKGEAKSGDLISWLIDSAPPQCLDIADIVERIMVINMASIHTTSMTVTNALFDLAAYTQYVIPLREEVEAVIAEFGWTKEAMAKMYNLDSFLKESSRLSGIAATSLGRKVLQDFTFSDGTTIPAGCTLALASHPVHHNAEIYEDPLTFDGFRFVPSAEAMSDPTARLKDSMVSLDFNYLLFGHGRHACPGRFFAVSEIKAIMAHFLIHYDIKLPNGKSTPPAGKWFGGLYTPDREARVLLRLRSRD